MEREYLITFYLGPAEWYVPEGTVVTEHLVISGPDAGMIQQFVNTEFLNEIVGDRYPGLAVTHWELVDWLTQEEVDQAFTIS